MRKILHVDLDAFFCSVEELKNPSLKGKPFAVGGMPGQRGVVASCSYAARQFGVRSAMSTGRALALCPELILVSGRHSEYESYSRRVMEILAQISPLVEIVSIDEAFVDISDLPEQPDLIARRIQQKVREEVQLPCSVGIAGSKLVAKIATDIGKSEKKSNVAPCAIKYIPPGSEEAFLAPLPVAAIPGVGPKTETRLRELGIEKIQDLQHRDEKELQPLLGKNVTFLIRAAHGQDSSPVEVAHELKSISQETTFSRDVHNPVEIERTIRWLTEKVARRLRENRMSADTIRVKIRLKDFSTHTRQARLSSPTDVESTLLEQALQLFRDFHSSEQYIRLIGVGVSGLGESWHQMGLWEGTTEKEIKLHQVLDQVQQKYGKKALQTGKLPEDQLSILLYGHYQIIPGLFMAGPFPISYQAGGTQEILETLLQLGIRQFVDLTEPQEHSLDHYQPLLAAISARRKVPVQYRRFPIPDRGIPAQPDLMVSILDVIDNSIRNKNPVYVHCQGGIGRTGTVVGCWLVRHGSNGKNALREIRNLRSGFAGDFDFSPETAGQRLYVETWGSKAVPPLN